MARSQTRGHTGCDTKQGGSELGERRRRGERVLQPRLNMIRHRVAGACVTSASEEVV